MTTWIKSPTSDTWLHKDGGVVLREPNGCWHVYTELPVTAKQSREKCIASMTGDDRPEDGPFEVPLGFAQLVLKEWKDAMG
jgi:hypothetical protein